MIFQNASGDVIGFGGNYYEEVLWLSKKLNFRYNKDVKNVTSRVCFNE